MYGRISVLANHLNPCGEDRRAAGGAGELLVREGVRHPLSGSNLISGDRGDILLKGFEDTLRLTLCVDSGCTNT